MHLSRMACVVSTNHKPGTFEVLSLETAHPRRVTPTDPWITGFACVHTTPLETRTCPPGAHGVRSTFPVWPSLPREGLLPGLLAGEPARLRHTGKVCASRVMLRVLCSGDGRRGFIPRLTSSKTRARLYRAPTRVFLFQTPARICALAFVFK